MKSLNRTLSLVLVLAMCLGLMGFASAATFTDNATVQYKEAVGVMTGIGAINGYSDGTFKPTGTITREEAAKMVCYAVLGSTVAAKLSVSSTGFSDVAASRWSAPFIGYCVSQGIINGMGDGTFAPTANVTGYQLAKMMLAAAGWGKASEFTGASWELNVAVTANKYGVFTGSKTADFSAAATREEAALYVFNALYKVPEATYSKLTESYTKSAQPTTPTHDLNSDGYYSIADELYTTLTKSGATVGGASGYFWKLGATTISGFVSSVTILATSTDDTPYDSLITSSNAYYMGYQPDTSPVVSYVYNDATYANGADATFKAYVAKNGSITNFLDSDNDGYYDIVSVTVKTVEKLAAAPSTSTSGAVTTVTVGDITTTSDLITYPADLVKGDVILYYKGAANHYYVEKATAVTGTIASFTSAYVTIDSKKYYPSDLSLTDGGAANVGIAALQALIGKTGNTYYLDNGGNICYVVAATGVATVSNTVFVAATQATASFGTYTFQAAIAKPDGTQDAITVKKVAIYGGTLTAVADSGSLSNLLTSGGGDLSATAIGDDDGVQDNGELISGEFYTYTTNTDGSYNLTVAKNTAVSTGATAIVTGGQAKFLNGSSLLATSSTIFMYYDATAKTYTVKTGISNALSYNAAGATTCKVFVLPDSDNVYAQIVICMGAVSTTSASGYDQIFVTSAETTTADANSNPLYSYTAVVNGVKDKTITSYQHLTKGVLYFAKDYATNGAINDGYAYSSTSYYKALHTAVTDVVYSGSVLTVKGASTDSYILNSAAAFYLCRVSTAGTTTVSAITADTADALVYANNDDQIYVVQTSSSDTSIAAVYIYVKDNSGAALTYSNTNYKVYTTNTAGVLSGEVVTGTAVAAGTTLFVQSNTTHTGLTSSTALTTVVAATPSTTGIYSFVMPSSGLTFSATLTYGVVPASVTTAVKGLTAAVTADKTMASAGDTVTVTLVISGTASADATLTVAGTYMATIPALTNVTRTSATVITALSGAAFGTSTYTVTYTYTMGAAASAPTVAIA